MSHSVSATEEQRMRRQSLLADQGWPQPDGAGPLRYPLFIKGQFVEPGAGAYFSTESPFEGVSWARIARGTAEDAERAVEAAHDAFASGPWPALRPSQRGELLWTLGQLVEEHAGRLAEIEQRDNGKLMTEVSRQIAYMAKHYKYYAGIADKIEGKTIAGDKPGFLNYTRCEPKGVVVCITPYNSPLILASWKLAPALAAGCTVVLKPSEYTSASALEFARLIQLAGFPEGVVNVVTGFGEEVGEALIGHPRTAHVAFTGGEATGRRVYTLAARGFKSVTLELGGKSPNIVFDDCDLDAAVQGAAAGILSAAGQSCMAGSRLLLHESLHDAFVDRLMDLARSMKVGDPKDPLTQIGPIGTRPQFERIMSYIQMAKDEGAVCVLGGTTPNPSLGAGQFVLPTIFTEVRNDMRIAQEEVFGPVLAVLKFKDEAEAVRIANDVAYGLAGGIWTKGLDRALRVSEALQAGTIWVNGYRATSFTSPFGGYKRSGIGRENGVDAVREYLEVKSVWLAVEPETGDPTSLR